MSLALFSNGYLAIVAEESNSVKDIMLRHLQELFEDVEVYGWMVVREYNECLATALRARMGSVGR